MRKSFTVEINGGDVTPFSVKRALANSHNCFLSPEAGTITVTAVDSEDVSGQEKLESIRRLLDSEVEPPTPDPTYDFAYEEDEIRLYARDADRTLRYHVSMKNGPDHISIVIGNWEREFRIDADAAREMIAEPRELGTVTLIDGVMAIATRYATGWQVRIVKMNVALTWLYASDHSVQPEAVARALFQEDYGPYITEPQ